MGRILGVDLGARRVGVALSDPGGVMASPYEVIDRNKVDLPARLAEIIEEEGVERVVVGLPLSLSGQEGPAAASARAEVEKMQGVVTVPIELFDERLTTVSAERPMMEMKMRADARRRVVDKVAAAVMLQAWLDARSARG